MEQPSTDGGVVGWIYRNRPARFVVSCVCRKTLLRLVGRYADSRLSRIHIRRFAEKRGIADWQGYGSLNAFFARPRANVAFPAREDTLGSPCQALVCAWDQLRPDAVVQVKGVTYPLAELLDEDATTSRSSRGTRTPPALKGARPIVCGWSRAITTGSTVSTTGCWRKKIRCPGGTTRCMRRPSPTCRACTPRTTG